jgi:hypothetical protein
VTRAVPRDGRRHDSGAITAELALALPAVVLVVAVVLVTLAAGGLQLRAADAARTGARLAALGLDDDAVVARLERVLPGADVRVLRDPPWVEVTVAAAAAGGWLTSGPLPVRSSATAWVEP